MQRSIYIVIIALILAVSVVARSASVWSDGKLVSE